MPSLRVAITLSCCVWPALSGMLAGLRTSETADAPPTVKVVDAESSPDLAVTTVDPAEFAVTTPVGKIGMPGLLELQATGPPSAPVVPSANTPDAVSVTSAPNGIPADLPVR